jgi:glycosyl transferase family 87
VRERAPLPDGRGSVSGFDDGRWVLAAAVLSSLPLFAATLGQRQDIALLLLILGVSLKLRALGYPTAAGFVLSLLAIKIHLFLLVPVALLMRREWRMMFGLAGGGIALLGISFAVAGRNWVREYLALISNPGVISDPAGKPNLHGVVAGWSHAGMWEVVLSVAVVVAVAAASRRSFEMAFAAGMLGSFLVSNHAYVHDCAVLIPGLVEIVGRKSRRQPARPAAPPGLSWLAVGLAVTLLTPFPYFLPPLLIHIREGVAPAVLIAATLAALIPRGKGENKA